jgi:hypothetical protein
MSRFDLRMSCSQCSLMLSRRCCSIGRACGWWSGWPVLRPRSASASEASSAPSAVQPSNANLLTSLKPLSIRRKPERCLGGFPESRVYAGVKGFRLPKRSRRIRSQEFAGAYFLSSGSWCALLRYRTRLFPFEPGNLTPKNQVISFGRVGHFRAASCRFPAGSS